MVLLGYNMVSDLCDALSTLSALRLRGMVPALSACKAQFSIHAPDFPLGCLVKDFWEIPHMAPKVCGSRFAQLTVFNTSQNPLTYLRFLLLSPLDVVAVFPHFPCTYVTIVLFMST